MMDNRVEIRPGRTINIKTYLNPDIEGTLFFIHGLGGRGDQWRDQIDAFKGKYNLIIPDLLGHGKSDKPRSCKKNNYQFTELEQDLQAVFRKYATEKNIIIGHSYGGALATSLALEHQDNVDKLILLSPTPCAPNFSIPFLFKLPTFMLEILRPVLEKDFKDRAFMPNDNPQLVADELKAGLANPMYVIRGMIRGTKSIPTLDVTMLSIPILTILGSHDKLVTPESSRQFYQAVPHHRFETIEQAAHLTMLEKPDLVNEMISDMM